MNRALDSTSPPADVFSRSAMAAVRIVIGLLWLQKAGTRIPPDFRGLFGSLSVGAEAQTLSPFAALLDRVVAPNVQPFGWAILSLEILLGAFLLLGLMTRFWGFLGLIHSVLIALTVLNAPGVSSWLYYLMFAGHLALVASAAGRTFGLDGVLRPGWVTSRARFFVRAS